MDRVGKFEKVSFEVFANAMQTYTEGLGPLFMNRLRDELNASLFLKSIYEEIQLPTRATSGSAGYDFYVPFGFSVAPGETVKFPTGIRVAIADGWFLCCAPRSGLGSKYRLQIDNTIGIIDSDYYYSDNEGQMYVSMTNCSTQREVVYVNKGKAYMQGVFMPYGITYDDNAVSIRNGGLGSTS